MSSHHGLGFEGGTTVEFSQVRRGDEKAGMLRLQISADYFALDRISTGFVLGLTAYDGTYLTAGARLGAAFDVIPAVSSVWPKISYLISPVGGGALLRIFQAYVPIVWHALPHFFFGLGPAFERMDAGDWDATASGLLFTLGGYWKN